jgi:hypothetical protein
MGGGLLGERRMLGKGRGRAFEGDGGLLRGLICRLWGVSFVEL